jgi:hypothetical protein
MVAVGMVQAIAAAMLAAYAAMQAEPEARRLRLAVDSVGAPAADLAAVMGVDLAAAATGVADTANS